MALDRETDFPLGEEKCLEQEIKDTDFNESATVDEIDAFEKTYVQKSKKTLPILINTLLGK